MKMVRLFALQETKMRKSKLNKINRRKQNEFLKANGRTPAQIQRIIAKKNKKKG